MNLARRRIPMPADLAGLELARLRLRDFLQAEHVEEHTIAAVELVCEEIVTNTLRYGYGHGRDRTGLKWVELDLAVDEDHVDLTVEDDAQPFDPVSAPVAELPATLDDAKVGGMGLRMVRNTASQLVYERLPGKNRLMATIARQR
jgi:anti-sigma regulatory factor (Ser/Thr protein kinase)